MTWERYTSMVSLVVILGYCVRLAWRYTRRPNTRLKRALAIDRFALAYVFTVAVFRVWTGDFDTVPPWAATVGWVFKLATVSWVEWELHQEDHRRSREHIVGDREVAVEKREIAAGKREVVATSREMAVTDREVGQDDAESVTRDDTP